MSPLAKAEVLPAFAGEALRFATVGGVATVIHLATALLAHAAGFAPLWANATAFGVAFLFSWAGHARWTFRTRNAGSGTLPRFFAVSLLALCFGQVAVWLVVDRAGLPFVAGLGAVVATVPLATFFGARAWAFAEEASAIRWDLVASLGIVAVLGVVHSMQPLNHDVAWLVTGAERLLDGGTFGREVEDVTPPWAWWLLVPVAWITRVFELDSSAAVASFVGGLAAVSLVMAARFLPRGTALLLVAATLVLVAGYDWAQREHLFAITIVPWVLLFACRANGGTVSVGFSVAVGTFAALGLLQKPHFLLVPIALELWLVVSTWRERRWRALVPRPEAVALVAIGFAYVSASLIWAAPWFDEVLPRMMIGYGAYANDPWSVGQVVLHTLLLPLLLLVAFRSGLDRRAQAFLVACAGAALAAVAQSKGWAYHLLPSLSLAVLAAGFAAEAAGHARPLRWGAVLALLFVVVQPSVSFLRSGSSATTSALAEVMAPEDTVMAFNTSPRTVHPAVRQAGAIWTGRAGNLHFVPGAAAVNASEMAVEIGREQGFAALSRLEAAPPRLLLVDDRPGKLGFHAEHDWLRWFETLAPRRLSALLARYDEEPSVVGYRVFRRRSFPPSR